MVAHLNDMCWHARAYVYYDTAEVVCTHSFIKNGHLVSIGLCILWECSNFFCNKLVKYCVWWSYVVHEMFTITSPDNSFTMNSRFPFSMLRHITYTFFPAVAKLMHMQIHFLLSGVIQNIHFQCIMTLVSHICSG